LNIICNILVILVAVEALAIMLIEVFGSPELHAKAFDLSLDYTRMPEARISMSNQGIYNGFLGIGLLLIRFFFPTIITTSGALLFTIFIVVAAVWGWLSAHNVKIFLVQGIPALLATIFLFLS
jgi:putative membrane protein